MDLPKSLFPWLQEPGEGLLHELIQLLTNLTRLAAAMDKANTLNRQACQSLLDEFLQLEQQKKAFYAKFNGRPGDPPVFASGELKSQIPDTCELFGPAYKFRSVDEANLYILLWTTLSYVYPLVHQLQFLAMADVPECLRIPGHSPKEAAHRLTEFYTSRAVRCLPYCAQEGMNSWAMMAGMIALTQSSRVFSHLRDWERFSWTQDVVQYCALLGFDRASQLREVWWNYWLTTEEKGDLSRLPHHKELAKKYQSSSPSSDG